MKLTFKSYGNIQTATADGIKTYEFQPGESADLPDDVAALFLASGVADAVVKVERAVTPAGEKTTKK